MEQKLFDIADLFESRLRWWEAAVVRGADAFMCLPRPRPPRVTRELQTTARKSNPFVFPYITGETNPRWVYNSEGDVGVAKEDSAYSHDTLDDRTAAREKIVSDLARLAKVLVPPVQLWERKRARGRIEYFSVSCRFLADARDCPPDDVLMNGNFLACAAILDEWVHNGDRMPTSIIYGKVPYADAPEAAADKTRKPQLLMFIDHGLSRLEGVADKAASLNWLCWNRKAREYTRKALGFSAETKEAFTFSAAVEEVLGNIEHVGDRSISDIVTRLPDQLFMPGHGKQQMIDGIKHSRDTVRTRVFNAFAVA